MKVMSYSPPSRPATQVGVTLVELMVVVVIVGILTTIAVRNFAKTRLRSTRQDAADCLTLAANRQETYYARNNGYATTIAQLSIPAACGSDNSYLVSPMACGSSTDPCYGFQASPNTALQAGQAQSADGTLKLEMHYTQKRPDLRVVKTRQPASGAAVSGWS